MATALQQSAQLRLAQSRRPASRPALRESSNINSNVAAPQEPSAALQLAKSLATGQRNKNASMDKQIVGEAAARAGQVIGTYFGGVGGIVGKRIGRVLGEHWRLTLFILFLQIVVPFLFLSIGFFIILTAFQSFIGL